MKAKKPLLKLLTLILMCGMFFALLPGARISFGESSPEEETGVEAADEQEENTDPEDTDEDENETETEIELKDDAAPDKSKRGGDSVARINGDLYSSLAEAVDAAADGDVIEIINDIELAEMVSVAGKNITLRDDGNKRTVKGQNGDVCPLFSIEAGASLRLDGTETENLCFEGGTLQKKRSSATIAVVKGTLEVAKATITGGTISGGQLNGAINILSGGHAVISDGVIKDTQINNCYMSAAVFVYSNGKLDMTGGKIANNKNDYTGALSGGGVCLFSWNKDPLAVMNMSGGTIEGNEAQYGGGVYMTGRSKLHMTGGNIDNNIARRNGGGICVSGTTSVDCYDENEFIMDGGSISGNRAANGGGIYVNSDAVYLNGGYIENNEARYIRYNEWTGHGGGIYVSAVPRVLHISNSVITENTAQATLSFGGTSGMGGGLWACPTGSIHIEVTNGVAVYGNAAVGNDTAGDDIVKVNYSNASVNGTVTMADRMLGGGRVYWYQDGGVKGSTVGYVDGSVPRFDPDDPGEPLHFDHEENAIAAKAVTSAAAIKRANEEATLFIRDNKAGHGGGIGTNGDLTLKQYDYPEWKLTVTKAWEGIPGSQQEAVEIFLKIGDEVLDSVTLSKENGWTASFEGLPVPGSLTESDITVIEGSMVTEDGREVFKETEKYIVSYEKEVDENNSTISIAVSNKKISEDEPPADEEGPDPEETANPSNPVKTGDDSPLFIYGILLFAGGAGLLAILIARRRRLR